MSNETDRFRRIQQKMYNTYGGRDGRFAPPPENVPHFPTAQELQAQKLPSLGQRCIVIGLKTTKDFLREIRAKMRLTDDDLRLYSPPEIPQEIPESVYETPEAVESFQSKIRLILHGIEDFMGDSVSGFERKQRWYQIHQERKRKNRLAKKAELEDFEF